MNEVENVTNTEAEVANTNSLNVQDLSAFRVAIDLACQRGAFRPNEMSFVGQAYDRLTAFLTAFEEAQKNSPKGE